MEQRMEGDVCAMKVKNIGYGAVSFLLNGRIMGLLTDGVQGGDESRDVALVRGGGGLLGCLPNPGSDLGQLVQGGLPGELHDVDINRLSRPQRFIFPDEVDQVMRGVDERGTHGRKLVIEFDSFGAGKHASIDANTRVFDIVNKPFDPVLRAICVTGSDEVPI